jgi:hypothetical protein
MSKCVSKWKSRRIYDSDHHTVNEIIHVDDDSGGVLTGHHESGKPMSGRCLNTGMTLQLLSSAGGSVEIDYAGDFGNPNDPDPQCVHGRFTDHTRHDRKRADGSDGDWTAVKTT